MYNVPVQINLRSKVKHDRQQADIQKTRACSAIFKTNSQNKLHQYSINVFVVDTSQTNKRTEISGTHSRRSFLLRKERLVKGSFLSV
jgi:hypothetical protein